jgi:hypothetical protein
MRMLPDNLDGRQYVARFAGRICEFAQTQSQLLAARAVFDLEVAISSFPQ